jgi:hypothetical protein
VPSIDCTDFQEKGQRAVNNYQSCGSQATTTTEQSQTSTTLNSTSLWQNNTTGLDSLTTLSSQAPVTSEIVSSFGSATQTNNNGQTSATQTRPLNRTNANNIQKPKWSTWATFKCIVTKTRHSKSNLSETINIAVNNHKLCDFLARKKFIDRKFYLNKYYKITF